MTRLVMANILRFVVLIVLQILMLNYVDFGGYMIPFIYILAVLMLPTNMGRMPVLLCAFGAGLMVDLFCNIPGFHTFSCTLLAFMRVTLGNRMLVRDGQTDVEIEEPSIHTVPTQSFMAYLLVMAVIYSLTYCLLEAFSFGNFWITMLSALLDSAATWVVMMMCQIMVAKKV